MLHNCYDAKGRFRTNEICLGLATLIHTYNVISIILSSLRELLFID